MTPQQFARVRQLFDKAMDLPAETRLTFLASACTDDSDVRREVERLVRQDVGEELVADVRRALDSALETRDGIGVDEHGGHTIVGHRLSHYEVLEELSRGGMGIVYKALDTKLNREVALKVLPPKLVSDPNRKRRFLREAQSAAALKHPNIAVLHQIDEVDGQTFLVMELIEGETLRDILARGPLSVDRARTLALDTARGLAKAHSKGIIHRDIKPANLMITEDGELKIIDFGLAKLWLGEEEPVSEPSSHDDGSTLSRETMPGTLMGTIGYMSPEQVRAVEVDARSDVFSFGAVVYEMLSGELAFGRETTVETLSAILGERPPEFPEERGDARDLMSVVRRCLEKSPADRFPSATALVAALEALGTARPRAEKSVAILAFTNMSPDPDNEYFSDGMSEEIINALHHVRDLRVASRTASFSFKNQLVDIAEVGAKLNVAAVLEGSVRKVGNKLRITAQLIDVADGYHLWSESFDREWGDVFAIQDEIAQAIVDELKVVLVDEAEKALVEPATENLDAYQLYLQGRFYWNRRELRQAIHSLEQAIAIDPDYALAHAGLAAAYAILGFGYGGEPREVMGNAKKAAEHALRLEPSLAETHYALAYVSFVYDFDWASAAREFEKAIELDPDYVAAHYMYGFYLWLVEGRLEEAIAKARRAVELDPLDSHAVGMLGLILSGGGLPHEAIPLLKQAIERDPNYFFLYRVLGIAYQEQSRHFDAASAFQQAAELSRRDQIVLMELGVSRAACGDGEAAVAIVSEFEKRAATDYVSPLCLAAVYGALGRIEEALTHLERAYRERDPCLVVLKRWPTNFEPLHGEPRFEALLERIGLS